MTKTIKMSLVAATAVAAFSSTASAGSLEEAIKGVSIKGQVNVEYVATKTKDNDNTAVADDGDKVVDTENGWEYDVDLTATIPVNDMITAELGWQMDTDVDVRDGGATPDNAVTMTKANFTAKTSFATFKVGKQGQPTPFLDDNRGNGIVALVPAGPVTLAAGHFTNLNGGQSNNGGTAVATVLGTNHGVGTVTQNGLIDLNLQDRDVTALAVIGSFGPVNAQLWYATLSSAGSADDATDGANVIAGVPTGTTEKGADALALIVGAKVGPAQLDFLYAQAQLEGINDSNFDKEKLYTLTAGMDLGPVALTVGAGMTNDAQHDFDTDDTSNDVGYAVMRQRLHGTDLSGDGDAKANMAMEIARLDDFNDAKAFLIGVSSTFGKYTVGAAYLDGSSTYQTTKDLVTVVGAAAAPQSNKTKVNFDELDLSVSYAMSKNFTIKGTYAMLDSDYNYSDDAVAGNPEDTSFDMDQLSLQMTYKF